MNRPEGSVWGRWDLHFHTPSSYDYKDKSITNQQIVQNLVDSMIVLVAVTDHHLIDPQRIADLSHLGAGRLTVLPGIELRTDLGGKESVHIIGLFDQKSELTYIWTKLQGKLGITPTEVQRKGDDQVYVQFEHAALVIHELGGYVSVHVGRKSNSIENIGNEHPYKMAFKEDLARKHIDIFEVSRTEDIAAYEEKVFPKIGFRRPIVLCSDNHKATEYSPKAPCWIKGDPCFRSFQQIVSDPTERVYVGTTPPLIHRVEANKTKYISSIEFTKTTPTFPEAWFSGKLHLNPGLIAIIGNKGSAKTALAETIALLGNTSQSRGFTFLNSEKFRQPKNNKSKHFSASIAWHDGKVEIANLGDNVKENAVETVAYIPQNYLEVICNELRLTGSPFDQELKAVIFSHVDEPHRLGAKTLDELIEFRTEPNLGWIERLRTELTELNLKIAKLRNEQSSDAQKQLENLFSAKQREIDSHMKAKPAELRPIEDDPAQREALSHLRDQIARLEQERNGYASQIKTLTPEHREALLKQAICQRVISKLQGFRRVYENLLADIDAECRALGLAATDLLRVVVDQEAVSKRLADFQIVAQTKQQQIDKAQQDITKIQPQIETLIASLDKPNQQYQAYKETLKRWEEKLVELQGDEATPASLLGLKKQIEDRQSIPERLRDAESVRNSKTREIYKKLSEVVDVYKYLYKPVQDFVSTHTLASGRFSLEFEASISCAGLEDQLLSKINQGRRGSFAGAEEGRKVLNDLIKRADFLTEDGAIGFANAVWDHLNRDRREAAAPMIPISEQVRKGVTEAELLDTIYSLKYLIPKYSLKWSGKSLEELSPGERGTLLLIFYLLVDRRDTPLILDQPEENLDNRTVYDILVPCIKEARGRRQAIIVTHNPNLAVVCDADQIIHCHIDKTAGNKVTYETGALENERLNKLTIDVLEGTRPAFSHRDSKYQEKASAT
jgi:ABC-type lipoprotein export system ATPase subunit